MAAIIIPGQSGTYRYLQGRVTGLLVESGLTILIGIVAAIVGGILTTALIGAGHTVITFIVAVLAAALIVSAFTTRGYGRYRGRTRRRPAWRRW